MAQSARIVYIEPNDIASVKGINGGSVDNATWNPEDLNMSVDLQVVVPDINDCGLVDYSDKAFNMSLFEGKKLRDRNFLTTDYINIGFQEFKKNESSDKENLGVNSIDINFDEYFFPEVSVRMTDVRGDSLLSPTEYGYYNDLQEEKTGKKNNFKNLYKCLFHFPYPKFFLTVKGFYGTNVTFELAQSDFKTTFNSDTGNFDVQLNFKGYLYGLYTDIPINYILIAPYIDSEAGTGDPGSYWTGQSSFTYDNGDKMCTFVEFIDKFVRLAETVAKENDSLENSGDGVNEYVKAKEKVERFRELYDCYKEYIDTFSKEQGIHISTGDKHYAFFGNRITDAEMKEKVQQAGLSGIPKATNDGLRKRNLQTTDTVRDKLARLISSVNNDFGQSFEFPNVYPFDESVNVPSEIKMFNASDMSSWFSACDGDTVLRDDINGKGYIKKYNHAGVLKTYGVPQRLKTFIDSGGRDIMNLASSAVDDLNEVITKYLGFKPTVRNVFRMLFAHIQTFMHFLYEETLSTINTQMNSNERVKVSDVDSRVRLDIPKNRQADKSSKLPPFVGMYEENNGKWEMAYPYDKVNMPEVQLVDRMVNAAMCFRKKINDILDYIDKSGLNGESNSGGFKMRFLPLLLGDIYYKGRNPYSFLKFKDKATNDSVGEIIYLLLLRLYAAYMSREEDNDEDSDDRIKRILKIEACNYFLSHPKREGDALLSLLKNLKTDTDGIKNYLSQFITNYEGDLVYSFLFDTKNGKMLQMNNAVSFPMYLTGVFAKTSKKLEYKENESAGDGAFKVFREKDKIKITSFQNYSEPLAKIKDGVLDDEDVEFISGLFNTTVDEDYFENTYNKLESINSDFDNLEKHNFRLYKNNDDMSYVVGEYDSKTNEDKDYKELLYDFYNSRDLMHYRIPGLSFDDIKNAFTDGGYATTFKGESNYVKGAVIVSLLYKIPKMIQNHITIVPWFYFLYIGAAVYVRKNNLADKIDISSKAGSIVLQLTPSVYHDDYMTIFKDWANKEGKNLWNLLEKCDYENNGKIKAIKTNSTAERTLLSFFIEQCYVYGPVQHGPFSTGQEWENIKFESLTTFFETLCDLYDIDDESNTVSSEQNEQTETDTDVSKNTKLSIYRTLKSLNDKWLSSYTFDRFKLSTASAEDENKKSRYGHGDTIASKSEWDSFLYIDAFYNDIGNDIMISPKIIYDMIIRTSDNSEDYNLYQFMADLLQKNKMMLIPLPVYSNYHDSNTLKNIFSPHATYTNKQSIGNTFLCMYVYEPSHVVEDKTGGYDSDALQIADGVTGEISSISNPDAIQLFHSGDNLNITVPAFGVTFAKQNQSYFKDICISMDTPQTTDYGILNTFELAKLGGRGFSGEPFATGQDIFSIYSNRSYKCEVTMMGCANIMPMMYFQLNNVPMFNGAYMITNVSHSIVPGDFVTKFTGIRVSKNQLPFNKDIFNINSFMTMVKDFIARGGTYDPAANAGYQVGSGNENSSSEIEKVEGDFPISVNGIACILAFEGWSDKNSRGNSTTYGEKATAYIPASGSEEATVGPGLTTSIDKRIKNGVTFTGEQIMDMLVNTIKKECVQTLNSYIKDWKQLPQYTIDALLQIAHVGANFFRKTMNVKAGHPQKFTVQQLEAYAYKEGERLSALWLKRHNRSYATGLRERHIAMAHIIANKKTITGVNASNKEKFNQYWNPSGKIYEVAKKIYERK